MSEYKTVYERQGTGNGPMYVNDVHSDLANVNPEVAQTVTKIQRAKDSREAINSIALNREKTEKNIHEKAPMIEKPKISPEALAADVRIAMENGEIEQELEER